MSKHKVQVRRVYDDPARGDGNRVLVDRIWPRGMTKEKAELDEWCKTIAPSTELRMVSPRPATFHRVHPPLPRRTDPTRTGRGAGTSADPGQDRNLTLLTASKAVDISEATVLAEMLS